MLNVYEIINNNQIQFIHTNMDTISFKKIKNRIFGYYRFNSYNTKI